MTMNQEMWKSLRRLTTSSELGFTVCIWNDRRVNELKDVNDMVLNGLTQEDILEYNRRLFLFVDFSAKAKFMEYKKV